MINFMAIILAVNKAVLFCETVLRGQHLEMKLSNLIWLRIAQFVMLVALTPLCFHWITWLSAVPRTEVVSYSDQPIPEHWDAVLGTHQGYVHFKLGTVAQNPLGFAANTAILFLGFSLMFWSDWSSIRKKRPPE